MSRILLVDRGNCSFVTQAHHAYKAGIQLLIVADNVDESIEGLLLVTDHSKIMTHSIYIA